MTQAHAIDHAPRFVRLVDPMLRKLLGMGLPMGPNVLLTVRGRRSGKPRSAGVALVEIRGRRWVLGAYGAVHWVRNLRAAGEAELRVRGRPERVRARELTRDEAVAFFRGELIPDVRASSLPMRLASRIFVGDVLRDPEGAAERHPVFELEPML